MSSLQFPSVSAQASVAALYILGLSVLAHCISRRISAEDFSSWESIRQIAWPRLCIILVFIDSWLFIALSNVFIFGVGLETHLGYCKGGIFLCIFCYATSKLLSYLFLIEKVHVVWSPTSGVSRLKSTVWIVSFVVVCLYSIVIAIMIFGRVHFFRDDDSACMIGLTPWSAIPLLSYDVFINAFLTALFLWPLFRSKLNNPRVKRVATRTLVAAGVSLTTSTANIALLAVFHGHELGWVCLGLCGGDVLVNAFALFWVTSGGSSQNSHHSARADLPRSGDGPKQPPRLHLTAQPPMNSPRKSNFFDGPPAVPETRHKSQFSSLEYDYLPTSTPDPARLTFNDDSPIRSPQKSRHRHKAPSVVKTVAKLFRTSSGNSPEEHDLQVTVTTEYDVQVHADASSEHSATDVEYGQSSNTRANGDS